MTRPDAPSTHVRTYLAEVRHHLRDLPPDDRAELTAPVEHRLLELAEHARGPADIERQFGPPAELAADLRSSAGYPQPTASRTSGSSLQGWLRDILRHPAVVPVVGYVSSLRPAWWALRGYLLLGGVLAALGSQKYRLHTIGYYKQAFENAAPQHLSTLWVGIPLLAVLASIVLGVVTPRLAPVVRLGVVGLNLLAVVALLAFPTWWLPPAGAYFAGLVN